MTALGIGSITFACTFGSALLGSHIRDRLPAPHLSKESQDVVRLGMGLVATMTALLLGLVTAAARTTFDEQSGSMRNIAVNVLTLDRHLARFGAETRPTRDLLRRLVAYGVETTWPLEGGAGTGYGEPLSTATVESFEDQILDLAPQTEAQRWFKNEAMRLT